MGRLSVVYAVPVLVVLLASTTYAAPVEFFATLSGANETPTPTGSPGTGFADVVFDPAAHSLHVQVTFSGLLAPTTVAHIHCCGAQTQTLLVATTVPTFPGFPLGVTAGTYDQTFDTSLASTYNPAFVTMFGGGTVAGAEAALFNGMVAGQSYLNIHTAQFAGGEIRGPLLTPEPGTLLLLGAGLTALAQRLWRTRRRT